MLPHSSVCRRFGWVLVATAVLTLIAAGPAVAMPRALDDYVDTSFTQSGVPGMVAVAVEGDRTTLSRGFGHDATGAAMSTDTPLRVASLTKTVTSVAVHQLVEKGQLELGDPVVDHLPEFQLADPRAHLITVQQLLDQTSGMTDRQVDLGRLNASGSLQQYVGGLSGARLAADPGTAHSYCNVNFEVLARLVEVVTGMRYDTYLRAHVFGPLGMAHSTVDVSTTSAPDSFQDLFGVYLPRRDRQLFWADSGANGLVSTATDLAVWARWLASGKGSAEILRPQTRTSMIDRALASPHRYADGLELRTGERVGHSGLQFTDRAMLLTDPQRGTAAVVVINTSGMTDPTSPMAAGMLDVMANGTAQPYGHQLQLTALITGAIALVALVLGVIGVRRANRWAQRRRHRIFTGLRLAWLLLPAILLALTPQVALALTQGRRTLTWVQTSYLMLTPLVALAVMAVAGLATFGARVAALRRVRSVRSP